MTEHQKKVYQLCSQIPLGKFSTYKAIAKALHSSPLAVGQALKNNPTPITVPCHRVIASDFQIGGYCGETNLLSDKLCQKIKLLKEEGLEFDHQGYLTLSQREDRFFEKFIVPPSVPVKEK